MEGSIGICCFIGAPIILHFAAVCEQKVRTFRAIHRAATAESDDEVYRSIGFRDLNGSFDIFCSRVRRDIGINISGDPLALQVLRGLSRGYLLFRYRDLFVTRTRLPPSERVNSPSRSIVLLPVDNLLFQFHNQKFP